jgi:hypothetical protein
MNVGDAKKSDKARYAVLAIGACSVKKEAVWNIVMAS